MTCTELRNNFDAYIEGTLSDADAAALESHLDECLPCQEALEVRDRPLGAVDRLPRSITPAADLWPGIETQLASRRRLRGRVARPGWLLAAAAILLIAISSGGTALLLRQNRSVRAPVRPSNLTALESQYSAASAELTDALEKARSQLSPETVATIERSLRIIDDALTESRAALARDPGNEALGQLVVAAWRQKVDLLRRAMAIGKAG